MWGQMRMGTPSALLQPCLAWWTASLVIAPHAPIPPLTMPSSQGLPGKQRCKEAGKRSWGQQAFLNFFVSEHKKMQQHAAACSNMDRPSPGFLWLMDDGHAAEVLDAPSTGVHRAFCHLAVTLGGLSLLTGSQSLLYRDAPLLEVKM